MNKPYGYAGKILRINLSDDKVYKEPLDLEEARLFLGGRGFNAHKLYKEVKAGVDPLGLENKLMIATGRARSPARPTIDLEKKK